MEQTGKLSHLSGLFVPYILVKSKIKAEIDKLSKILNSSVDDENEDLKWKLQSLLKINAIESCYLGIINIFDLGLKINTLKLLMSRKLRRKIKFEDKNSKTFIEKIKEFTGIEVKEIRDLEKVRKHLQHKKDKFNELYTKQPKTDSKVHLMSVVLGVFSYLNQPINEEMTIVNFAILREEANKGIERDKTRHNAR